jgi:DNA processing protein
MNEYISYLKNLNEFELKIAPKELHFEGNWDLIESGSRVSVVGSRKVSDQGVYYAQRVAERLVSDELTVVSGLAAGVDTIAHETAIKNGGRTIAVIGTPLDTVYPRSNVKLSDEIKRNHLMLSQFPIGYPVTPKNFPMRNRVMAMISDATIIIEAGEKSGTKHQGWEALKLGRELFIFQDVLDSGVTWAHKMLEYGAHAITLESLGLIEQTLGDSVFAGWD